MKCKIAAFLLVFLLVLPLFSCQKSEVVPEGTYKATLVGVEIFTYEFSGNEVRMYKAGVLQASGTFTLKGDVLTLDFGTSGYVMQYDADSDAITFETTDYGTLVMRK